LLIFLVGFASHVIFIMERFIWLLFAWIMSGNISPVNIQDTWRIQEQFIVNDYFRWVDEQTPLVYRSWRILWQEMEWIKWWEKINRTDCSGILVWHMAKLWIVDSRNMEWTDWLDSDTLIKLWKHKNRSEVIRWDWVYMEFPDWVRHIAVSCDTWAQNIYDLYLNNYAKCRPMPPTSLTEYSSNGEVEYLNTNWIILPETKEILLYFQKIKDEATWTRYIDTGSTANIWTTIITFIQNII
jgi:hypothetical protein